MTGISLKSITTKLSDAIADYKAETKEHKSRRTYLNYAHAWYGEDFHPLFMPAFAGRTLLVTNPNDDSCQCYMR